MQFFLDVIVTGSSNDRLSILRAVDKEPAHTFIKQTLQNVWKKIRTSENLKNHPYQQDARKMRVPSLPELTFPWHYLPGIVYIFTIMT
ncbi:hypothetical protein DEN96_11645 [Escherichia coli]|nr:hypothetical protein AWA97_11105 [Escherichia coli O104:H21 str. CFSAN002236]KLH76300.1 hypothetical protein WR19_23880 [Escherichia coli]KNG12001.1 hypothetical protein WQ90_07875 [Escherichia coli]OTB89866.1 hypothetical protein AW070_17660 [Escherichia coli]TFW94782.1 hypothetical protein DEO15_14920 [Escherichia coli]